MRIISKRESLLLYLTATVIVVSAAWNFFLKPSLGRNARLSREIALAERKLKNYRTLLNNKDALRSQFNTSFASVPTVSAAKESSLVTALSELERIARESDVQIVDVRPQGFQKGAALYHEALIEVRAEGGLEGFTKFIYNTEKSSSLLRIKKFQLMVRPEGTSLDGAFSVSLVAMSE